VVGLKATPTVEMLAGLKAVRSERSWEARLVVRTADHLAGQSAGHLVAHWVGLKAAKMALTMDLCSAGLKACLREVPMVAMLADSLVGQ